jgi:hypothetical protein
MQQATRVLAMLLVSIFMQSCAMKQKPRVAIPILGARTTLEIQLSEIAWTHAECYLTLKPTSFEDPKETISRCKEKLLEGLSMKEAKALRDYFNEFYPTVGDAFWGTRMPPPCGGCGAEPPSKPWKIAYDQTTSSADDPSHSRVSRMFDWITAWVSQRLIYKPDSGRYLLNLTVTSYDRNMAQVTLLYVDGTTVQAIPTAGVFQGIYRGLYRYKVEKNRYKSYDSGTSKDAQHLNLVDWDWNENGLSCPLVPNSSQDDALPCKLQQGVATVR